MLDACERPVEYQSVRGTLAGGKYGFEQLEPIRISSGFYIQIILNCDSSNKAPCRNHWTLNIFKNIFQEFDLS